jgi:DNA primase
VNVSPAASAPMDAKAHPDPELYSWLVSKCAPVTDLRGTKYLEDHGIQMATAELFGVVEMRDPKYAYMALANRWGHVRLKACGLVGGRSALLWSGYALVFPFKNAAGVHYLQVRCLEGDRKFIGPSGVTKPIFNQARLASLKPNDTLHICEGIPDALAIEGRGIAAVGILGATSFRNEWVEEFLPFELIGVPDGDGGGKAFRLCLTKAFHARSKSIAFVVLPAGEDASDVISRFTDA